MQHFNEYQTKQHIICYQIKASRWEGACGLIHPDTGHLLHLGSSQQSLKQYTHGQINQTEHEIFIRHINPLMFDVIDDKLEGVARGFYHVYTRARKASVYTQSYRP